MQGNSLSIVLASVSPRRRQLLEEAEYDFTVCPSGVDESAYDAGDLAPSEYAKVLALAKASDVAARLRDAIVLGADTVVDFDGAIIGKPADAVEAERITRKLFSRPHKVITGVAIVRRRDGLEIVESDSTTVYPKRMTEQQIAEHIIGGTWEDKAGAYAIAEGADEFVEHIEGSLTNVMGLPMELLARLLGSIDES